MSSRLQRLAFVVVNLGVSPATVSIVTGEGIAPRWKVGIGFDPSGMRRAVEQPDYATSKAVHIGESLMIRDPHP